MARRTSRRGAAGWKPQPQWGATNLAAFSTLAQATKVLAFTLTVSAGIPETLRRTRGLIGWKSDQSAASETPIGAFGMCVVSADAAAAGVASVPGPFSDDDSDLWVVHQFVGVNITFADATGFASIASWYEVDSKAMRTVTEDERLVGVWENGHASQASQFWHGIRVLSTVARG